VSAASKKREGKKLSRFFFFYKISPSAPRATAPAAAHLLLLFASLTARATLVSCFLRLASACVSLARLQALAKRFRPWRGLSAALRCDAAPTGLGGAEGAAEGGVRSAKNAAE